MQTQNELLPLAGPAAAVRAALTNRLEPASSRERKLISKALVALADYGKDENVRAEFIHAGTKREHVVVGPVLLCSLHPAGDRTMLIEAAA